MAEDFQKHRQYQYAQNSNLVLEAERDNRRQGEGSTDVMSLSDSKLSFRMGDRALVDKRSVDLDDRIEKARFKRAKEEEDSARDKKSTAALLGSRGGGAKSSVLIESADLDAISYRPKTRDTRLAYEEILTLVQAQLGDQPNDIIRGASDEVIAILKNESVRENNKLKDVEKLIGMCNSNRYSKLVTLSKKLVDFSSDVKEELGEEKKRSNDEVEVAVVFDDDDEDDEGEMDEEYDEDDEDGDGGDDESPSHRLKGLLDNSDARDEDDGHLRAHDIDAHWLQRQLSKFYSDANMSAKISDDTLAVLNLPDERLCENKLVVLLDYDKFDLIKVLLKNRYKIYYCTLLKQAQSESERANIEARMIADAAAGGSIILAELGQTGSAESWSQDKLGEITMKARKEARALNRMDAASGGGAGGGGARSKDQMNEIEEEIKVFSGQQQVKSLVHIEEKKIVDLEQISFHQGSHKMSSADVVLPEKSWRAQKKGYEEVHVPAIRPVIPEGEVVVDIEDLPNWCQPAFAGMRSLNRIQSRMVNSALMSSENLLLCAPTGAGKTNVALMCMLNQIGNYRNEDGSIDLDAFKIVYIAPMKALVQECVLNFGKKLKPYGINVRELSGDNNLTRQQIQDTQIIVTTPEKWDIVTRKSGDRTYTQLVRLMIIDEIHLLHDDRGPVLESVVARTIRQVETTQEMVRLVGLSATLPNYEDVAAFLRVDPAKGLFFFDGSFRPVPLQQQMIGITEKKPIKRFQLMNEICYEKVLQHAGRNQILIFTHSRADTVKTAQALRDMAVENDQLNQFIREDSASKEILREEAEQVKSADLKSLLPFGFAVHHAGLQRVDRSLVEELFSDKHIQVLVCTATLAWGVNLPCHTVIIKGTQMYSPELGKWTELSPLDIMQMMGRAGRYGLDSEGEGIIITQHSELRYYLSLMNQQLPIESQFVKKLPDMLNAEIVLGNVSSIHEAATWLGYTYLFVRMLRNPQLYGIDEYMLQRDPTLMIRRLDLVHTAATILDKHSMIKYDRKSGYFQVLPNGRVASYYYVSHDTMNTFNEFLKPSMNDIEIFRLFSLSGEFKQMHVREEEKLELSKLVAKVPIPVKESIDESSAKINVLLQAYISRLKLEGFQLSADMVFVQQSACRIMRALFEISLRRGWSALSQRILTTCKIVERRTWQSQSPLRQFAKIPDPIIKKLEKVSDIRWDRYYDLSPNDIGEMVKIPNMGTMLHKLIHKFPKVELSVDYLPITRSLLKIDLHITADFDYDLTIHDGSQMFWIIVEDVDGEKILHSEPFLLRAVRATAEHNVTFFVPLYDPIPPQYFVRVINDRWLHSQTVLPISFRDLILPAKFPPPTELLDLQPLPVSAIGSAKIIQALFPQFKKFNAIQTQAYTALFEGSDHCLICAPTGSGKTACAEIAIVRHLLNGNKGKTLYVAPHPDIVKATFDQWDSRFSALGLTVSVLTGDLPTDQALIEKSDIILSSSEHWDMLSRRWKQRKFIHQIMLYVFDEMHMIGGLLGPTYEVIVSRTKYMIAQLQKPIRIIALSSSLANAKDVADWIGAPPNSTFNFPPSTRPVPLDLHFFTFDLHHASSRILSMAKPAYNIIVKNAGGKPSIIYVSSKKQVPLTAIDMMAFATANGQSSPFLPEGGIAEEMMSLDSFDDVALKRTVLSGVGFLHSGLSSKDHLLVEKLYRLELIQVLVVPNSYCYKIPGPCYLTIVMDTVAFDGREHRYVDYSIPEMLQMIGSSSRPLRDDSGKAFILCHSSKKEYLKKLVQDPLPIESHLNYFIHDHINSEIVTKRIENKQDAVDYYTYTFYYKRITQNPVYYGLQGTTHKHLSDHYSELIESITADLENSKCVAVEDDYHLSADNLGMIASYYYIQYTTIELFSSSLDARSKLKGLLEILSSATEYIKIPIRSGEEGILETMLKHLPKSNNHPSKFDEPSAKVLTLLQTHFCRYPLSSELFADLKEILVDAVKLIQAMVDVISSGGWLAPALAAMELSQMVVQGLWNNDSALLQIPHFDADLLARCKLFNPPIKSVFDLIEMEEDDRINLLQMDTSKMSEVAVFCNAYPSVDVEFELSSEEVVIGDSVTLQVTLGRDEEEDSKVVSLRFPGTKAAGYWLVLGDKHRNTLLTIKRVGKSPNLSLNFSAPEDPGDYNFTLYLISDSYMGCDQEFEINLTVVSD